MRGRGVENSLSVVGLKHVGVLLSLNGTGPGDISHEGLEASGSTFFSSSSEQQLGGITLWLVQLRRFRLLQLRHACEKQPLPVCTCCWRTDSRVWELVGFKGVSLTWTSPNKQNVNKIRRRKKKKEKKDRERVGGGGCVRACACVRAFLVLVLVCCCLTEITGVTALVWMRAIVSELCTYWLFIYSFYYLSKADNRNYCCFVLHTVVLYCVVLYWAVLYCVVLCCIVLCSAVLSCAVLCSAVQCGAVLCCAVLCCAVLCCEKRMRGRRQARSDSGGVWWGYRGRQPHLHLTFPGSAAQSNTNGITSPFRHIKKITWSHL